MASNNTMGEHSMLEGKRNRSAVLYIATNSSLFKFSRMIFFLSKRRFGEILKIKAEKKQVKLQLFILYALLKMCIKFLMVFIIKLRGVIFGWFPLITNT